MSNKFHELKEIYYNAKDAGSFGGIESLLRSAKEKGLNVTKKEVIIFLKTQDTYTLHKPVRKNFVRNQIVVGNIDEQWQADLADLVDVAKHNDGFRYLLTVIDCFSKYAWVIPTKLKDTNTMVNAFTTLFQSSAPRKPKRIQTDQGNEFLNCPLQKLFKKEGIIHFITYSDTKAAIVERFNRTLKTRMWRYFTSKGTYRFLEVLQDLVNAYNHSIHRTIGMAPSSVRKRDTKKIWQKVYHNMAGKFYEQTNITKGSNIRIPKYKTIFEKGYVPNWTEEIFTVKGIVPRSKNLYKLKDKKDENIEGSYYKQEVQVIDKNANDTYRYDKIIKTKKLINGEKKYFVKWKGWPDKFNSWISEEELHNSNGK